MPRFARLLVNGMQTRGHVVEVWDPTARLVKRGGRFRKWFGYVDQYILFPQEVRKRLQHCPANTLFVFTDHALGPWVPLVADRPHVIHCHDFLAQFSALGQIPEHKTGWSGKLYQRYIRSGYRKGEYFISVSNKTRTDLASLLDKTPKLSETIYTGLNDAFAAVAVPDARAQLDRQTSLPVQDGYLLHVGGNQWYKNRTGVIALYDAWRAQTKRPLPLLLIGEVPTQALRQQQQASRFADNIHFLTGIDQITLQTAYSGATALLFPSLAEGFGWPIAEAMACGCPVITTGEAPMTEVGGEAAYLISKQPRHPDAQAGWASTAVGIIERVVCLTEAERVLSIQKGFKQAATFNTTNYLDQLERVYRSVLNQHTACASYTSSAV